MAKNALDFQFPTDAEIKRMFDAVPVLERYGVADKVVRAGSDVVLQRARQLTPRSSPEDRRKRSSTQRQAADWDYPLHRAMARVVRKYRRARGVAVIGPRWPKGNKAYLFTSPSGRKRVFWGHLPRLGGLSAIAPQVRNWIVQAFDETRGEQNAVMKATLKRLMDEIWRQR